MTATAQPAASPTSPPHIWVVDDDPDLLAIVGRALEREGWAVTRFSDAEAFWEAAREAPAHQTPDLMIVDLYLPVMSGLELIQALRAHPTTMAIPIMVLTGAEDDRVLSAALDSGASDLIQKPFQIPRLYSRVRSQLRTRQLIVDLERKQRSADFLLAMSRTLNSSLDPHRVLGDLVEFTSSALEVERCSIIVIERGPHMPDQDRDPLAKFDALSIVSGSIPAVERPRPAREDHTDVSSLYPPCRLVVASDDRDLRGFALDVGLYPEVRRVLDTGESLVIQDIQASSLLSPVRAVLKERGIRAMALFPMLVEGELVGILFLRSMASEGHFSPERCDLALAAADIAAIALRNAYMFDANQRERSHLDRALQELERTKHLLYNLIDASPDAIVASDMRGNLLVFNKAAEHTLGYTASEAIARLKVWQLYPGDRARDVMESLRSGRRGPRGRLLPTRYELLQRDGTVIPVSMSAAILYEGEQEVATVGLFSDLRDKLRMEKELAKANEELDHTRRQMITAQLAGAAAHELSQPLTSALGYIELLRMRLPDADATTTRSLDTIDEQLRRMAQTVKKIGRLNRYKTKDYVGETKIMDLDPGEDSMDSQDDGDR